MKQQNLESLLAEWCKRHQIEELSPLEETLLLLAMRRQIEGKLAPNAAMLSCSIGRRRLKVAHALAGTVGLPEKFDRWELADVEGWAVAHEGALCGNLAEKFGQWELPNNYGWTVADIAALCFLRDLLEHTNH